MIAKNKTRISESFFGKRNEYLIDAAAKLLKRIDNIKFMLVGDGPLMIKLKQRCNQYGIDKDVIFTGY